MLHIATVHYRSPRWIAIQARELRRHLGGPYRVWASLDGIDPGYAEYFDRVVDHPGGHDDKLNRLALEISAEAADDDLLLFLDGDAFPIADPGLLISAGLADAPLLAVRRAENFDDPQPHPCFCVTRVATWRELPGDWSPGYTWPGPEGEPTTDIGANLLRRLELSGTPWTQVLRSNRHDLHPLLFGVYGDVVYHHGAGFRSPLARVDVAALDPAQATTAAAVRRTIGEAVKRNRRHSEAVFERIERDDPDWLASLA